MFVYCFIVCWGFHLSKFTNWELFSQKTVRIWEENHKTLVNVLRESMNIVFQFLGTSVLAATFFLISYFMIIQSDPTGV